MQNILGYCSTSTTPKGMKEKPSCINIVMGINICILTAMSLVLQYMN